MIRGRAEKRTDPAVVAADAKFGTCVHWVKLPEGWSKCAYCGGVPAGLYLRDIIARIQREEA